MFGELRVRKILSLTKIETACQAVDRLLEFADYPQILRWFQFPTALVIFVGHSDCPDCGAVYVYDRKHCAWFWIDFDDQNYGGYSPSEFDLLIEQCHFFQLAESPALLTSPVQWLVTPGQAPSVVKSLPA